MASAFTHRRPRRNRERLFGHTLAAARKTRMGAGSAELAVAGELERGKALFVLSVAVTVVAGIACVVCVARMGLAIGFAPPPSPSPPPPIHRVFQELFLWSIAGV